jgi:hypothetical protein
MIQQERDGECNELEIIKHSQKGLLYAAIPRRYAGKMLTTKLIDEKGEIIEERNDWINKGSRYKTLSKQNDPNWLKVKLIECYVDGVIVREAQIENDVCDCGCLKCWLYCEHNPRN